MLRSRWPAAWAAGLLLSATVVVSAAPAAAGPLPAAGRLHQSAELSGDPTDYSRRQGRSVAMSGDGRIAVVGAVASSFYRPGRVYVFARDGAGDWRLQATLYPLVINRGESQWGSAVAISADGGRIAIGDDVNAGASDTWFAGVVDTYRWTGRTWAWSARVQAPAPKQALFGYRVALSGNGGRLLVGAPGASAAWTFEATTGGWGPGRRLPAAGDLSSFDFGRSVALSTDGRTAVIGADRDAGRAVTQGSVSVFSLDGSGVGRLEHTVWAAADATSNEFGSTVAVSADGRTVVAGDPGTDPPTTTVFDRRAAGWARTATFVAHGTAGAGEFGFAVAVSADGDTVLSTAPFRHSTHPELAAAGGGYRFQRDATGWHWGGAVYAASPRTSDLLGYALAVSADGRTALLGALGGAPGHAGSALVFTG